MLGKAGYTDPQAPRPNRSMRSSTRWPRSNGRAPRCAMRDLIYHKLSRSRVGSDWRRSSRCRRCSTRRASARSNISSPRRSRRARTKIAKSGLEAEDVANIGGGLPAMMKLLTADPAGDAQGVHGLALPVRQRAGAAVRDRRRQFRVLRQGAQRRAGTAPALEARDRHRRRASSAKCSAPPMSKRYFPATSKASMQELVGNLRKGAGRKPRAQQLDGHGRPRSRLKPSSRASSPRSAIRTSSRPTRASRSAPATRSAMRSPPATGMWKKDLSRLGGPIDRSRMVHAAADGERLLQRLVQRDRVPARRSCSSRSSGRTPTSRSITARSAA